MNGKEFAKFFCGFEAFHTIFHAYLWLSGTAFAAFGITATPMWNSMAVIVNGAIAVALGLYGWGAWRPRQQAGDQR